MYVAPPRELLSHRLVIRNSVQKPITIIRDRQQGCVLWEPQLELGPTPVAIFCSRLRLFFLFRLHKQSCITEVDTVLHPVVLGLGASPNSDLLRRNNARNKISKAMMMARQTSGMPQRMRGASLFPPRLTAFERVLGPGAPNAAEPEPLLITFDPELLKCELTSQCFMQLTWEHAWNRLPLLLEVQLSLVSPALQEPKQFIPCLNELGNQQVEFIQDTGLLFQSNQRFQKLLHAIQAQSEKDWFINGLIHRRLPRLNRTGPFHCQQWWLCEDQRRTRSIASIIEHQWRLMQAASMNWKVRDVTWQVTRRHIVMMKWLRRWASIVAQLMVRPQRHQWPVALRWHQWNQSTPTCDGVTEEECDEGMKWLADAVRWWGIALRSFENVEGDNDVIELSKAVKQQAFDVNDHKQPSLRITMTWNKLAGCWQGENEELIHHKRFVEIIKMVKQDVGRVRMKTWRIIMGMIRIVKLHHKMPQWWWAMQWLHCIWCLSMEWFGNNVDIQWRGWRLIIHLTMWLFIQKELNQPAGANFAWQEAIERKKRANEGLDELAVSVD